MQKSHANNLLRIRPYAAADEDAVVRLIEAVLREFGFSFAQVGDLGLEAFAMSPSARAALWVAEQDDIVVGTVSLLAVPGRPDTCEIKRLYLERRFRGGGNGQALYDHAEAFARSSGYARIRLDSSRRFERAHALYVRNGFVKIEDVDNEWQDSLYEKELRDPA